MWSVSPKPLASLARARRVETATVAAEIPPDADDRRRRGSPVLPPRWSGSPAETVETSTRSTSTTTQLDDVCEQRLPAASAVFFVHVDTADNRSGTPGIHVDVVPCAHLLTCSPAPLPLMTSLRSLDITLTVCRPREMAGRGGHGYVPLRSLPMMRKK